MKPLIHQKYIVPVFLIALSLTAQAVVPAPDGGYGEDQGYGPANTAEGEDALFSLYGGDYNTAIGFNALYSTQGGEDNTARRCLCAL